MKRIAFIAAGKAGIVREDEPIGPAKALEVRGRSRVSLISPGTELNLLRGLVPFPFFPGYATVFQIEEIGEEVSDLKVGDNVLGTGPHQEFQIAHRKDVILLPDHLNPAVAVFARLAGVSMSTLNTTTVRPPARVLVTGLGPVGNLAAQIFARCGYQVTAVDPQESRRKLACAVGLKDVRASVTEDPALVDAFSLALECSGHEKAALDACNCIRKRGEVVLVGMPWKRQTEIYAQEILKAVFKRYVVLRSGWEWEVPAQLEDFHQNSLTGNLLTALHWLADGSLNVQGMAAAYTPDDAENVYQGLLDGSITTPAVLFDWRKRSRVGMAPNLSTNQR